jgi:hypothetical protein
MTRFKIKNYRGGQIIDEKNKAVGRGLFKGISHILNTANNIAPKDEGTLIQTSGVDVDEEAGAASAYYTQKYAARLHENPQYDFQGGREGKWLEKTLLQEGEAAKKIIADEIKDTFGG